MARGFTRRSRSLLALALAASTLAPLGCAGTGTARSAGASPVALYEMRDYEEAYRAAVRAHRGSSGRARERYALTAGLAAHALGRETEAATWLRPVRASSEEAISGRAEATLGLIELSRTNYVEAGTMLSSAGRSLDGEPAARAHFHAAEAFALAGRPDTARLHLRLTLALSADAELRDVVRTRLGERGFTVQLGAFAERANAQRAASDARSGARALGLDPPRIVEHVTPTGTTLHLVQVGRFVSRDEASRARVQLGRRGVVTTLRR